MLQKIKNSVKEVGIMSTGLTLAFIIFIGLSISNAWVAPSATPPGGNLGAPINTSNIGQTKIGGLILNTGGAVNGLTVQSGSTILKGALQITSGAPGAGKVLTSDASGNASWAASSATGTTNVYSCPALSQICYGYGFWNWSRGCNGQLQTGATCTYGECGTNSTNCTLVGKI
ncbi:MAG: hypothetical protein Q7T51_04835 [Candidatus Moranbacteria bacterium]|nr:hypothetical protein [Candidatus Moranbacteria bacterium]